MGNLVSTLHPQKLGSGWWVCVEGGREVQGVKEEVATAPLFTSSLEFCFWKDAPFSFTLTVANSETHMTVVVLMLVPCLWNWAVPPWWASDFRVPLTLGHPSWTRCSRPWMKKRSKLRPPAPQPSTAETSAMTLTPTASTLMTRHQWRRRRPLSLRRRGSAAMGRRPHPPNRRPHRLCPASRLVWSVTLLSASDSGPLLLLCGGFLCRLAAFRAVLLLTQSKLASLLICLHCECVAVSNTPFFFLWLTISHNVRVTMRWVYSWSLTWKYTFMTQNMEHH